MTRKEKKTPKDISQLAKFIVDKTIATTAHPLSTTNKDVSLTTREKNPAAVALGRLGGLKGGKARAAKLSAKKRKTIAQKAAKARWTKKRK